MPFFLPSTFASRQIRIVLAGVGGSGSEVLDGLSRIDRALRNLEHPGLDVIAFDPDTVSVTNTIRQRFWPSDVGQNKAVLSMYRYGTFGGLSGRGMAEPLTPEVLSSLNFDILITCVDRASVRKAIGLAFTGDPVGVDSSTLWLDLGNSARQGQVVLGHLHGWFGSTRRLPNVCELFPELIADADALDADNAPSCSAAEALAAQDLFINRWVSVAACDLLWHFFRQGAIDSHICFVAPDGSRVQELKIAPSTWQSFGLNVKTDADQTN